MKITKDFLYYIIENHPGQCRQGWVRTKHRFCISDENFQSTGIHGRNEPEKYLVSYGDGVDNGGDGCNQPETLVVVDLMWRHIYKYSFTCPLKKLSDFLPEIPPFGITWD